MFLIHTNFLTIITISLFYYYEKAFILMDIQMIRDQEKLNGTIQNYGTKLEEELKEQCFNTYKFSNNDNNKFVLLLRKGVYLYEYIDDQEKLNKTSFPEKKTFIVT